MNKYIVHMTGGEKHTVHGDGYVVDENGSLDVFIEVPETEDAENGKFVNISVASFAYGFWACIIDALSAEGYPNE